MANSWYWDTGGDGAPLVLLHAATGSALNWDFQRDAFKEAGFRVIAYSRRGHHRSSQLPADAIPAAVDDLEWLVDRLRLPRFHILGVAAGGFYAVDYALSNRERLLSLTAACSMMGVSDRDWRSRVTGLHPPRFRELPMEFVEVGPSYRFENPDGLAEWHRLHALAHDGGPEVLTPIRNDISWERLEALQLPVLLIAGGADLIVPAPAMREIAAHIPGAELAEIPDAGHSAPWERPAVFNRCVSDFLARVAGS